MSNVYFIPWSQNQNFAKLLSAAGLKNAVQKGDLVALKTHMGEKGGSGYIKPDWIKLIADEIKSCGGKPFITDTNTIYHGKRSNAVEHMMLAEEHGFNSSNVGAPVIIADGPKGLSETSVPVNKKHLKTVKIASGIRQADCLVVASHFKGHLATGFGGAIKNLGMGCATRMGKFEMHSGVAPVWTKDSCTLCGLCIKSCAHGALSMEQDEIKLDKKRCVGCGECIAACRYRALSIEWGGNLIALQEKLAEYALGAASQKRAFYINFANHITPNCDCLGIEEEPLLGDIGILASLDPVAIDQACLDLIVEKAGDVFRKTHPQIDGTLQLSHAEKIGLGSRKYKLVSVE